MQSVAGAYLALLASRGVNFLFGNGGTDFAPIIEAYAEAAQKGVTVPRPKTSPSAWRMVTRWCRAKSPPSWCM
jgi:hypothetical protein